VVRLRIMAGERYALNHHRLRWRPRSITSPSAALMTTLAKGIGSNPTPASISVTPRRLVPPSGSSHHCANEQSSPARIEIEAARGADDVARREMQSARRTSTLVRIPDLSRTSRHVRKVPKQRPLAQTRPLMRYPIHTSGYP
jgi:hypothetical protein